jgi:hypothetical protein
LSSKKVFTTTSFDDPPPDAIGLTSRNRPKIVNFLAPLRNLG